MVEFWDLTPHETYLAIEAALWRDQQRQRQDIVLAWRTAALTRAKKMPSLAQLLAGPAKPLTGQDLERRRREFKEMSATFDMSTPKLPGPQKPND